MSWWPLDQLDPVPVGVHQPGRPGAVGTARGLGWSGLETVPGKHPQSARQVAHLDRQMVEATDVDGSRAGTVDQLQRGHRLLGEAQHCETSTVVERDAAELPVAQGGVEVERSFQVRDAVGDEEGLHAATPSLLEQAVRPGGHRTGALRVVGGMFWLRWKRFSGSTASLSAVSLVSFAGE